MTKRLFPEPPIETFICKRLEAAAAVALPSIEVRAELSPISEHYIVSMRRKLLAYVAGSRIIRHPDNWWEAFKERWFPKWLLKKFPVCYKTYDSLVVFPDFFDKHPLPKSFRDQNYYFAFMESEEEEK